MRDYKHYIRHVRSIVPGRLNALNLRIFLGAAIGLALASPAVPAQAQAELDVSSVTSWTISGIMPGDSGTETITLSNIGDVNGYVFIWVTNIVSGEGAQPESETGDTSEPGELLENLLFSISSPSPAFSTDLVLPTTLDNFPSIGESIPYITINPLIAGGADVPVTWHWELPLATGNEVQGDCITFDINYGIIDFGESTTTTFSGTTRTCECNINILGEVYEVRIDCCNNTVAGNRIYLDPDEINFLQVSRGTALICGECLDCGNYPRWIVMNTLADPPPPPEGMTQIGPTYEIIGYQDEDMEVLCPGVTFGKPVVLLLDYPTGDLPDDTAALLIHYYDYDLGQWIKLPQDTGRIAEAGTITAMVSHLSVFGIFASQNPIESPPEPPSLPPETISPSPVQDGEAHFTLSNLNILPRQQIISLGKYFVFLVKSGENIIVSANLSNNGVQEGIYPAKLDIDGTTIAIKDISMKPGDRQEIIFDLDGYEAGYHVVNIGGLEGDFITTVWVNWWLIGGFAGLLGLIIVLAWYYGYYKKRRS